MVKMGYSLNSNIEEVSFINVFIIFNQLILILIGQIEINFSCHLILWILDMTCQDSFKIESIFGGYRQLFHVPPTKPVRAGEQDNQLK